jgi:hypothetical protein
MFTQKKGAEKQLFAWLKKGKRQPAREKALRIKRKKLLTLTPGDDAEGRNEGDDDDDVWEEVVLITSPCDSVSGYWGLSAKVGPAILVRTSAIPQYCWQPKQLQNYRLKKVVELRLWTFKIWLPQFLNSLQSPTRSATFLSLFLSSGCF